MPSDLPNYVSSNSGEWIVVKENKKSARFRNPSKGLAAILTVRVDGGMIQSGARADFIVAHPELVDVIVELKAAMSARRSNRFARPYRYGDSTDLRARLTLL
jgi:hypothetical protein